MAITTFHEFLYTAGLFDGLLVDLCAEQGVISRAQLLVYMERHGIAPDDKDKLIERYCRTSILYEEGDYEYTVNPIVAGLVNFYERRGKLTHADFLRDQIYEIGKLTDGLQQHLFAAEPILEVITDTVDKLYLVVREVRESGYQHYQACMRAFGDMKRNTAAIRIDERIDELRTVHRRYIEPLKELIDPNAEPVRKITRLRQLISDLGGMTALLADSVELSKRRERLQIDIHFIDYTLIRQFETLVDTSRSLINSLLEEKNIKDALANCLGRLDAVWGQVEGKTIVASGFQASQSAALDRVSLFFNDVVHRRFIPRPRPMTIVTPTAENAGHLLLFKERLLRCMEERRHIASWPEFVIQRFADFPPGEQLSAIAMPLVTANLPVVVRNTGRYFSEELGDVVIDLEDFDIFWGPRSC